MILWFFTACLFIFSATAEEPPKAEYPYPDTTNQDSLNLEEPVKKSERGTYYYSTDKKEAPKRVIEGVEKPYRVGDDGSYYYKTDKEEEDTTAIPGVEKPTDRDSEGSYYYKAEKKKTPPEPLYGEKPKKVGSDGAFFYDMEPAETKNVLFLRAGLYGPPHIQSPKSDGKDFQSVYSDAAGFIFTFEYDWKLWGELYLKAASGLHSSEGQGQFLNPSELEPKERFQFYIFPNTLSVGYKFQAWNSQLLTPYLEGGPGYFSFIEYRTDGSQTSLGGAAVLTASAGLLISLSALQTGSSLEMDYGITHTWFDLQYKRVIGLDARKDFSSDMITGGFAIGF